MARRGANFPGPQNTVAHASPDTTAAQVQANFDELGAEYPTDAMSASIGSLARSQEHRGNRLEQRRMSAQPSIASSSLAVCWWSAPLPHSPSSASLVRDSSRFESGRIPTGFRAARQSARR
jgi:hypothetical protein